MQIQNEFTIGWPPAETWAVLTNLERVAPCMPGAQLTDVVGGEYHGIIKVKLGAVAAQYKGAAHFESTDEASMSAVLVAEGRDTRGQGRASATVAAQLHPAGDGTRVTIDTDLSISGKVAQFGRGVMMEVSSKLLAEFAQRLEADLSGQAQAEPVPVAYDMPSEGKAPLDATPSGSPDGGPAATDMGESARRPPASAGEPEAIDLMALAGGSMAKRVIPPALAVSGIAMVLSRRVRTRLVWAAVATGLILADRRQWG